MREMRHYTGAVCGRVKEKKMGGENSGVKRPVDVQGQLLDLNKPHPLFLIIVLQC